MAFSSYPGLSLPSGIRRPTPVDDGLVRNGSFDTDTEGWSSFNSVISSVNGRLRINDSANAGAWSGAQQMVELISGESYTLSWDTIIINMPSNTIAMSQNPLNGTGSGRIASSLNAPNGTTTLTFTATQEQLYIWLVVGGTGTIEFDNVTLTLN